MTFLRFAPSLTCLLALASLCALRAPATAQRPGLAQPRLELRLDRERVELATSAGGSVGELAGAVTVSGDSLSCGAPGDHVSFPARAEFGVRSTESFSIELELRVDRDGPAFRTALMCREGSAVHYSVVIGRQPGEASVELWSWSRERVSTSGRRVDDGVFHRLECGFDAATRRLVLLLDGELAEVRPCRQSFAGSPAPGLRLAENLDPNVRQPLHGAIRRFALRDGLTPTLRAALQRHDRDRVLPEGAAERAARLWNESLRVPRLPVPGSAEQRAREVARVQAQTQDALGLWPPPGAAPRAGRSGPLDLPAIPPGAERFRATDFVREVSALPLDPRRGASFEGAGYRCTRVGWQSFPGYYATGWLFEPAGEDRPPGGGRPAVLCPHGHWGRGARAEPVQARAASYAVHGVVALAVDSVHHEVPALGLSSLSVMTWNNLRALQWLRTRSDVDPDRIACTGASGGGQQTYYLSGLNAGLAAVAPVVMAASFAAILPHDGVHCRCNHVPHMASAVDMPELAAAFAPRPQLFVTVAGDWTAQFGRRAYPSIAAVYAGLGAADRVHWRHFAGGHRFDAELRGTVAAFLGEALDRPGLEAAGAQREEPDLLPSEWLDAHGDLRDCPRDPAAVTAEFRTRLQAPAANSGEQARARLRRLFRPAARGEFLEVREAATEGAIETRFLVRTADGIELPVRRFRPSSQPRHAESPGPVLLLDPRGDTRRGGTRFAGLIGALVERNRTVYSADLRYFGELDVGGGFRDPHGRFHAVDEGVLALRDLLTVLDAGPELGAPAGSWRVIAAGASGATALFAAALEERIAGVAAVELGPTWSAAPQRAPRTSRLLLYGDLPDALRAAELGSCEVLLGGVPSALAYEASSTLSGTRLQAEPASLEQLLKF